MTPTALIAIIALTGYSVYRQTIVSEITGAKRFKLAIIYGVIGLAMGGFAVPAGIWGAAMLVFSLVLSAVVGLARGRKTQVWREADGRIMSKGTWLTIGLFLGMVACKFALGTIAYFTGIQDGAGFGEILVMIAIMVAVQAQILWVRAQAMDTATVPQDAAVAQAR